MEKFYVLKKIVFYFMYLSVGVRISMCSIDVLGTTGGQKRGLYPLELELQIVVSHRVGRRN